MFGRTYKTREEFERQLLIVAREKVLQVRDEIESAKWETEWVEIPIWVADEVFDHLIFNTKTKEWHVRYHYQSAGDTEPKSYSIKVNFAGIQARNTINPIGPEIGQF